MQHVHTPPSYTGRCDECGERLESPSRALRDLAAKTGAQIVRMTGTITISADAIRRAGVKT